jgi:myo-inositol-1(or 4)-monophosphatase
MKQTAIKAAKEAGKVLMKYYGKILSVKSKDARSLVTNADLEAEQAIFKIIKKKFPDHSILSEEDGFIDKKSDYKWIIDPLDGTHNYAYKIPIFGVSIALEHKKEIILGVIYFPCTDELLVAEKGKGSFLNNKKIKVSNRNLKNSIITYNTDFHINKRQTLRHLSNLANKVFRIRVFGAAVFDLALITKGSIEALIAPTTNPWDIAAGFLILEEAEGKITDFKGKKWTPYIKEFIASNKKIHNDLLRIVNK